MKTFLGETAASLYAKYGDEISSLYIMFPSRRARLFFTEELSKIAQKPLWRPNWLSIDELTSQISPLKQGERLRLVIELHSIYSQYHTESIDKFYFWGETLLADFDMIDKYMIDARALFENIEDIKQIESDISYLTDKQLRILQFWSTFDKGEELSDQKRKFLAIWKTLYAIYIQYRAHLRQIGIGYGGMIQRDAVERLREGKSGDLYADKRVVIAGFNALTSCEKAIFKHLSTSGHCEFYWDYDSYYTDNQQQEAGYFMRSNIVQFPASGAISHDNFASDKHVAAIATQSNVLQCKYAAQIVADRLTQGDSGRQTAIVLTDENILEPLLHSLSPQVGSVNVTMGYPLKQTLAYSFVERLFSLQTHYRNEAFYHCEVSGILQHPYIENICSERAKALSEKIENERLIYVPVAQFADNEILREVFRYAASWRELSDYLVRTLDLIAQSQTEHRTTEYFTTIANSLEQLRNSLDLCHVELEASTYISLTRRLLQSIRIPFSGEPLDGLQIMGILETRNLDFKNVIILSMTDDNFPGNKLSQPSYIPYGLRFAYGLPTPEEHESVYAYYFYRLLQRAENVYMLYCSRADFQSTGERSRYIYQMDYESPFKIDKLDVGINVALQQTPSISVAKSGNVAEALDRFLNKEQRLSPTSFTRYVKCPLQFYFNSVARIKADTQLNDEVDAPMFGSILHKAMEILYAELKDCAEPRTLLEKIAASDKVESAVDKAICSEFLRCEESSHEDFNGEVRIIRDIVTNYIRKGVLSFDISHPDFTVRGLEEEVEGEVRFESEGESRSVLFYGKIDRRDSMPDGSTRIADYKTGASHLEYGSIEKLFHGQSKERQANTIQTMLYSMLIRRGSQHEVTPTLYYVRDLSSGKQNISLREGRKTAPSRYSIFGEEFESEMRQTLAELFDKRIPFAQCEDKETCKYCDYAQICRR